MEGSVLRVIPITDQARMMVLASREWVQSYLADYSPLLLGSLGLTDQGLMLMSMKHTLSTLLQHMSLRRCVTLRRKKITICSTLMTYSFSWATFQ